MIQRLIKEADPVVLEKFLEWARISPVDLDTLAISEYIIEEGMTCYSAAKKRFLTGRSKRSLSALQYRAKCIEVEIMKHLGHKTTDYFKKLMLSGDVIVPNELLAELRESINLAKLQTEEMTYIKLIRGDNQ